MNTPDCGQIPITCGCCRKSFQTTKSGRGAIFWAGSCSWNKHNLINKLSNCPITGATLATRQPVVAPKITISDRSNVNSANKMVLINFTADLMCPITPREFVYVAGRKIRPPDRQQLWRDCEVPNWPNGQSTPFFRVGTETGDPWDRIRRRCCSY